MQMLRRVTIERRDDDGRWKLLRERDDNGESFVADDLQDALDIVLAAYDVTGQPKGVPGA